MKADLIERLRAHPNKFIGHWEDWANEADTLLREAAAALEAEASEVERRGLERALEFANFEAEAWGYADGSSARVAAANIARAIRELPEAPAQPELASAVANQLSGSRVGEPAREGNPEDHPRYPALLADAKAVRNENLDGSPRRHAVAKEPPPPSQDREPDSQRGAK